MPEPIDTLESLKGILNDISGIRPADVRLESTLEEELGIDSLEFIETVMMIEEEFEIQLQDEEAEGCQTVGHLVELINRKREEAGEA